MHLFMLFFANSVQTSIYQYVEFVYSVGFNIFLRRRFSLFSHGFLFIWRIFLRIQYQKCIQFLVVLLSF